MKETLEDYISKNFIICCGSTIQLGLSPISGYIDGIKFVNIYAINSYNINRYVAYCDDGSNGWCAVNASTIYMDKLNKVERILYVK